MFDMNVLTMTESVKEKLGPKVTTDLFDFFNSLIQKNRQEIVKEQAHEHDKIELRFERKLSEVEAKLLKEIAAVKNELKLDIADLRSELKSEIETSHSKLKSEIETSHSNLKSEIEALRLEFKSDNDKMRIEAEKNKADLIKWMFLFWIGTVITILGGLFGFLKLFLNQ